MDFWASRSDKEDLPPAAPVTKIVSGTPASFRPIRRMSRLLPRDARDQPGDLLWLVHLYEVTANAFAELALLI